MHDLHVDGKQNLECCWDPFTCECPRWQVLETHRKYGQFFFTLQPVISIVPVSKCCISITPKNCARARVCVRVCVCVCVHFARDRGGGIGGRKFKFFYWLCGVWIIFCAWYLGQDVACPIRCVASHHVPCRGCTRGRQRGRLEHHTRCCLSYCLLLFVHLLFQALDADAQNSCTRGLPIQRNITRICLFGLLFLFFCVVLGYFGRLDLSCACTTVVGEWFTVRKENTQSQKQLHLIPSSKLVSAQAALYPRSFGREAPLQRKEYSSVEGPWYKVHSQLSPYSVENSMESSRTTTSISWMWDWMLNIRIPEFAKTEHCMLIKFTAQRITGFLFDP